MAKDLGLKGYSINPKDVLVKLIEDKTHQVLPHTEVFTKNELILKAKKRGIPYINIKIKEKGLQQDIAKKPVIKMKDGRKELQCLLNHLLIHF